MLSQFQFLANVIEKLKDDISSMEVIQSLEAVRLQLTTPGNLSLHLSLNVAELVAKFPNPEECVLNIVPRHLLLDRDR